MNERDKELDAMLNPLRANDPDDMMLIRWRKALAEQISQARQNGRRNRRRQFSQLAVAAAIGFLIGAALLMKFDPFVAEKPPVCGVAD